MVKHRIQLDLLVDDLWCAMLGARTTYTPEQLAQEALYVILAALPAACRESWSRTYLPEKTPVDIDVHTLVLGENLRGSDVGADG